MIYAPIFSAAEFDENSGSTGQPCILMSYLKELFDEEVECVMDAFLRERAKKARGEGSAIRGELIRYNFADSWKLPA